MKSNGIRRLSLCAVLTGLALILSYVEALIPPFFAIPGIKLGLANMVVIFALYRLGAKEAILIDVVRIILAALLFGYIIGFLYSIAGAALSLLSMIILKRTGKFKSITLSIAGGVFHNIGQLSVAMLLIGNSGMLWYLAVLWISGIACGAAVGFLFGIIDKRIKIS